MDDASVAPAASARVGAVGGAGRIARAGLTVDVVVGRPIASGPLASSRFRLTLGR